MTTNNSRRDFLQRASALSLAGVATPWALNLAAIGDAAAAVPSGTYKALVCVFLYGGNDNAQTVFPVDPTNYDVYSRARGPEIAHPLPLPDDWLKPLTPLVDSRHYALSPKLKGLKELFDDPAKGGNLAIVLNVGPLTQVTTQADLDKPERLPPKLFSHNDQQSVWQASHAEGAVEGWGGRFGDTSPSATNTFTCMNVSSNSVFLTGRTTRQYQVTPDGAVPLDAATSLFGSAKCSKALIKLMRVTAPDAHMFMIEHAKVMDRSLDVGAELNRKLEDPPFKPLPEGSLAAQLHLVAQVIATSTALGAKKQVFMVSMGGFDTHNDLADAHPALLDELDKALSWFHQATIDIGAHDKVTTFTASDFGRTLRVNNDGSDHGWGSMHFVLGGAVKGQEFYGKPPKITLTANGVMGGEDDAGNGRLIPTTSVDQYAATLGKWFGVPETGPNSLTTIFPNLVKFTPRNLGFMG